jgi:hypothetical protein
MECGYRTGNTEPELGFPNRLLLEIPEQFLEFFGGEGGERGESAEGARESGGVIFA